MQRWFMLTLAGLLLPATALAQDGFKPLWNGKDLTGWDTWLSVPHQSVQGLDLKKNAQGKYTQPVGENKDPKKVYTIVEKDGQPAIRISGEIFGALTSQEEFENYHLKLEFKWGKAKWPPRATAKRDSGLLYHCYGGQGSAGIWMKSLESQIQEGDCGDFWPVGGVSAKIPATKKGRTYVYTPGVEPVKLSQYCKKSVTNENDDWNTMELMTVGQTAVHIVNGKPNMVLYDTRTHQGQPLSRGKIQLQSEGAEIFYRNIEIRPIEEIPEKYFK